MLYSSRDFAYLFDRTPEQIDTDAVGRQRVMTVRAGDRIEIAAYPLWNTRSETRKARAHSTREAQRKQNEKDAINRFRWLATENFGEGDVGLTLTYAGEITEAQARRDIVNYIRRIKAYRARAGITDPLKYMYVIEFGEEKQRVHHHMLLKGIDRDSAERLWGLGYANARRLQPADDGIIPFAMYMVKNPEGSKRWCCSKNLKKPVITHADKKLTVRQSRRIAEDAAVVGREIFERFHPGYKCLDVEVRTSDFVQGVYFYARMKRIPDKRTPKTRARARAGGTKDES